jgi:2-isopropylmalate synthase
MKNSAFQEKFQLRDFHTVTGINIIPTAVVKINTGDRDVISSEIGVGPVDAALKAIQKIVGQLEDVKIREYRLESITGGSDATAEVVVKIEDNKGHIVSSRKTGEDIVIASVYAMMDATNKMILRKVILSGDTISTQ